MLDSVSWNAFLNTVTAQAGDYVQNCLSGAQLSNCDTFKSVQLEWTSNNVQCAFDDLCLGPANASFSMDTGYLDSREHLGINSKDEERITWRQVTTCVPVKTEGHTKSGTTTLDYTGTRYKGSTTVNYTAAFYGKTLKTPASEGFTDPAAGLENMTYVYTNFNDIALDYYLQQASPYTLQ
jgi:hypothetical protein